MKNKAPVKNVLVLSFDIQRLPKNKLKIGEMVFSFDAPGCPELMGENMPTQIGFQVLAGAMAEVIVSLDKSANQSPVTRTNIIKQVIDRLRPKPEKGKLIHMNGSSKLIGI